MRKKSPSILLWVMSCFLLILSVVSLLMVVERVVSSLWQKYLFFGYETEGVITLSRKTGGMFLAFSLLFIIASIFSKKTCRIKGDSKCEKLSTWALLISCASVMIYGVVALSSLNAWRP